MRRRIAPEDRREEIINAALSCALEVGYTQVTRKDIAIKAGCTPGLVAAYYGSIEEIRRAIMHAAIIKEVLRVVAQGLADGNPIASKAPAELKQRALAALKA